MRTLVFLYSILAWGNINGDQASRMSPVVKAVREVPPAVVNISPEAVQRSRTNPFAKYFDKFFDEFLDLPGETPGRLQAVPLHLGSGVVFRRDGYILTNEHVILKASSIAVHLAGDDRDYVGRLIGADPDTDLAIIKIDRADLPVVRVGESSDLMIGEAVIAIGNPYGLSHTVTTGVVSALGRSFRVDEDRIYRNLVQTDASTNPGNSGGPLLNILGELIGVTTAIHSKGKGIGFAIPVNRATAVFEELLAFGEVHEAWIGLAVQDLGPQIVAALGYDRDAGVIVREVDRGSPAEAADLLTGDIIYKIAGKVLESVKDYADMLRNGRRGEKIVFDFFRQGGWQQRVVIARPFPPDFAEQTSLSSLGLVVEGQPGVSGVLVTKVRKGAPAHRIGVLPGDVVRQIDSQVIESLEDYAKVMLRLRFKDHAVLALQR